MTGFSCEVRWDKITNECRAGRGFSTGETFWVVVIIFSINMQNAPVLLVPSPHKFGKTVLQMVIFQVLDNVCEQICFPQKDCFVGGLGENWYDLTGDTSNCGMWVWEGMPEQFEAWVWHPPTCPDVSFWGLRGRLLSVSIHIVSPTQNSDNEFQYGQKKKVTIPIILEITQLINC